MRCGSNGNVEISLRLGFLRSWSILLSSGRRQIQHLSFPAHSGNYVSRLPGRHTLINMASVTTATSEWIQFFREAGIPAGLAVTYAVSFADNRIQKNMLMDLSKEIMMDLGITVIGDIIAILKHAKLVYRQDMCKMATEAITSGQTSVQAELRRTAHTPATRMIANALSRDSPPSTPNRRPDNRLPDNRLPDNRLSVTVSNKQASKSGKTVVTQPADEGKGLPAVKRRRVTAEMEGKYIVNMPKGTTARTRRILAQQGRKGSKRMSVFERLGAEAKAEATNTSGTKPSGVFSRLGQGGAEEAEPRPAPGGGGSASASQEEEEEEEEEEEDSDGEGSVLQYAGVLKASRAPAPPKKKQAPPKAPPTAMRRLGGKVKHPAGAPLSAPSSTGPPPKLSVLRRLGKLPAAAAAPGPDMQDNRVSSTRARPLASPKVSSTTAPPPGDCLGAQMDAGSVSVFRRLGCKNN
ncbi:uncharacterized protein C19orf47 homolog isoform X2 [Gadus chalcogrammus]|uniref:uncharacterized protein C19orf47 homolog isoform X2 n=1 Tax=Gadus chalcogrammus TaxID=1042646 RepID=UPI0024C4C081|nr:uncharacterized protein C19orf47 homolog isoform X2 [Gadus chalcogrammus]